LLSTILLARSFLRALIIFGAPEDLRLTAFLSPAGCPILGVAADAADDISIAANSETKDPIEILRISTPCIKACSKYACSLAK
jgi:hypothetical protein